MNSKDIEQIVGFENKQSLIIPSLLYPIEQAKTLIRISQNPTYNVQRVMAQVKQTYHIAGLRGCYTGFVPWFASAVTYRFAFYGAQQALTIDVVKDIDLDDLSEYRRFRKFTHILSQGIVYRTVAVVVSQPFYVVTVRMVAELITEETKYPDIFCSLWKIVREEGLSGLFVGLIPRLLADLTIYSSVATVTYFIHRNLGLEIGTRKLVDFMIANAAAFYCYPLTVMSSQMAINN